MISALILRIYDWLKAHPAAKWRILISITALLLLPLLNLKYNEEITDFIPDKENCLERLKVFQQATSSDKIFLLCSIKEPESQITHSAEYSENYRERLAETLDSFAERFLAADSTHLAKELVWRVDYEEYMALIPFIYSHIPYLMGEMEIARADSLLSTPGYIEQRLSEAKLELMLPTGPIAAARLQADPLGLFTPTAEPLLSMGAMQNCLLEDGHIFTPDGASALCILTTSSDGNESADNRRLLELITECAEEFSSSGFIAEPAGAAVITVENARRIKRDSLVAIAIALVLIGVLLSRTIGKGRSLLLIAVTLAFGWLCGLSILALIEESVSMIVVGIASIIIGIAANYPLHVITHSMESKEGIRGSISDLVSPLVTGNITTVGAFCALIPLNSPALKDLGIFAAAMLIGTILFSLIFLPQFLRESREESAALHRRKETRHRSLWRAPHCSIRHPKGLKYAAISLFLAATLAMGYFSLQTEFDSNLQNINYMTPRQRELLKELGGMVERESGKETIYIYNRADSLQQLLKDSESTMRTLESRLGGRERRLEADLSIKSLSGVMPSLQMQKERLSRWNRLVEKHKELLTVEFPAIAEREGFSADSFGAFFEIVEGNLSPKPAEEFMPLLKAGKETLLAEKNIAITELSVPAESRDSIERVVKGAIEGNSGLSSNTGVFYAGELSSAIAESLSADFNYIGFSCSIIVFLFLWLSFRKLSYAIIAFLPMFVSWIWILGTMHLLGIEFNLVNIILATFIFGQGDDYSIFITEGVISERIYKKRVLASFKRSILISAAIMFIGMGSLITAVHPALNSLGKITILGMAAVVAMASLLPPALFSLIQPKRG